MPRGATARKSRSKRRTTSDATGVSKARGTTAVRAGDGIKKTAIEVAVGDVAVLEDDGPELAVKAACAECSHPAGMHANTDDGDNMGACSVDECDCAGYATKSASAAVADPFARIVDGLSPEHAALVRLRLASFDEIQATLPDEHQPGAVQPSRRPGPAAPSPVIPDEASALSWNAQFVPEGTLTDDGRCMAPGSITWRELPLTLMAMTETSEGGHIGAEVSGRIDKVWRDDAASFIRGSGVFDSGEYGLEIARLVGDKVLNGVSVDLAIQSYEIGPKSDYFDAEGNWSPKPESERAEPPSAIDLLLGEDGEGEQQIFVVTDAVIGMVTVCPFPAFADAKIEMGSSLVAAGDPDTWTVSGQAGFTLRLTVPVQLVTEPSVEGLTAAAAGMAPVAPPAEWFADPELEELTALTVDEDGRIFGHAWAWDTCHTGIPDVCTTAPHSDHDYAYFHLGEIECDDGSLVSCGKITLDTGHADRRMSRADATAHYDHTGTVVADVVCGEDVHGGWVAGALRPDVDAEKARVLRAAALSGDWRNVNGNLELVALLAVNVPGFPVPRTRALVAAGHVETLIAAGVHMGLPDEAALTDEQRERLVELLHRAQPDVRHASDCAVHNMPALPNGPCDCGADVTEQLKALADRAIGAES